VATDGDDVCHAAWVVTSVVVPLLWLAVAENWRVSPGASAPELFAAGLTCTDVVLGGGATGDEPHAVINAAPAVAPRTKAPFRRITNPLKLIRAF
jgi:hypothetical protein